MLCFSALASKAHKKKMEKKHNAQSEYFIAKAVERLGQENHFANSLTICGKIKLFLKPHLHS